MTHRVIYSLQAQQQLRSLHQWFSTEIGAEAATQVVGAVLDYCDQLAFFPFRGRARDDLATGLRVIGYQRRAVIAFTVESDEVRIHGIYWGRQDYESRFAEEMSEPE